MTVTTKSASPAAKWKGKEKAIDLADDSSESDSSSSDATSDSDSSSDSSESDTESIDEEYLNALLAKARENARRKKAELSASRPREEEELQLEQEEPETLPSLDPGKLPRPYFNLGEHRRDPATLILDPDAELAEKATSTLTAPAPPLAPPELTKSGKPLTKKERKALKKRTAGPDWFDLPAPDEADLPRLYREVEALRLRNQLDPKRFYRKDEGEGKGIKGLPKYFAIGTILPSTTPFGTASSENLTRGKRKKTLVDELVDDAEAKRYAKKKFDDLQKVKGARGKKTLAAKKALRKPKW